MTQAPETGAINRLHFWCRLRHRLFVPNTSRVKISGVENKKNVVVSDVGDEVEKDISSMIRFARHT